jgi:outer membrane protein TolC
MLAAHLSADTQDPVAPAANPVERSEPRESAPHWGAPIDRPADGPTLIHFVGESAPQSARDQPYSPQPLPPLPDAAARVLDGSTPALGNAWNSAPRPEARGSPRANVGGGCPIDLSTALRLAARDNPTIALAREAILENLARQEQADALLLPSLAAGGNLHVHRGASQAPDGQIIGVNSQSLYLGGGAGAVGAQTVAVPAIRIFAPLGDAFLEPLVARQRVATARADSRATFNTVLLDVTARYLDLMGAEAQREAWRQSGADVDRVVRVTSAFAQAGQGRQADADRALSRALLLRNEISRAEERAAVASAQLARLLHLDPSTRLTAAWVPPEPLTLVDPATDLEKLISIALQFRPEVAARGAEVATAETRYRQEQVRPWLPTISAGFSYGTFGGGNSLSTPALGSFAARDDFDVVAVWTLENLGVGNAAHRRQRQAEIGQSLAERRRTTDRIRQEVADASAQSAARLRQIDVTRQQTQIAVRGFLEELRRIQGDEGMPIELLNSFDLLATARQDTITALTAYDQAQFRLFVSLGQPPCDALPNAKARNTGPKDDLRGPVPGVQAVHAPTAGVSPR